MISLGGAIPRAFGVSHYNQSAFHAVDIKARCAQGQEVAVKGVQICLQESRGRGACSRSMKQTENKNSPEKMVAVPVPPEI